MSLENSPGIENNENFEIRYGREPYNQRFDEIARVHETKDGCAFELRLNRDTGKGTYFLINSPVVVQTIINNDFANIGRQRKYPGEENDGAVPVVFDNYHRDSDGNYATGVKVKTPGELQFSGTGTGKGWDIKKSAVMEFTFDNETKKGSEKPKKVEKIRMSIYFKPTVETLIDAIHSNKNKLTNQELEEMIRRVGCNNTKTVIEELTENAILQKSRDGYSILMSEESMRVLLKAYGLEEDDALQKIKKRVGEIGSGINLGEIEPPKELEPIEPPGDLETPAESGNHEKNVEDVQKEQLQEYLQGVISRLNNLHKNEEVEKETLDTLFKIVFSKDQSDIPEGLNSRIDIGEIKNRFNWNEESQKLETKGHPREIVSDIYLYYYRKSAGEFVDVPTEWKKAYPNTFYNHTLKGDAYFKDVAGTGTNLDPRRKEDWEESEKIISDQKFYETKLANLNQTFNPQGASEKDASAWLLSYKDGIVELAGKLKSGFFKKKILEDLKNGPYPNEDWEKILGEEGASEIITITKEDAKRAILARDLNKNGGILPEKKRKLNLDGVEEAEVETGDKQESAQSPEEKLKELYKRLAEVEAELAALDEEIPEDPEENEMLQVLEKETTLWYLKNIKPSTLMRTLLI